MRIYLRLDGVRGEVMEDRYVGWLEISSYQLDPTKKGFQDIYLTCAVDSTMPVLSRMSADGTRIPSGELQAIDEKSGNVLLRLTFAEIVVASLFSAPARGGVGRLTQSIHLIFGKYKNEFGNPAAQPKGQSADTPYWDVTQQTGR